MRESNPGLEKQSGRLRSVVARVHETSVFPSVFTPPPPPSNDREREREREREGVEHFGADFEGIIPPRAGSFSRNEPSLGEIGARARARAFSPSRGRRKGDREDRGKRARTQRERRD